VSTALAALKKPIVLVLAVVGLAACSSTQLIYSLADEFIEDEIAFFLDLDEQEEAFLETQVEELVAWHRTSMLPKYATYLNGLANSLEANKYGRSEIAAAMTSGRALIEDTVRGVTPRASVVLARHMTDDDIAFMEKRMAERREEQLDDLQEPEAERYKDRLDRLESNFERFFGDLTEDQMALLQVHARATLPDSKTRLENRTERQKVFIEFLKTKPSEQELTAFLDKLLLRGHELVNPGYKAFSDFVRSRFQTLLVNIVAISTPEQRQEAVENLRDYVRDFQDISS